MIEAFASILICAVLVTGAYYASHYIVNLRHERNELADEFKRAEEHIKELEERVMLVEAQLDVQKVNRPRAMGASDGWSELNVRS
jgi:phage terminase Nu1 subunit (DNA packaging protein)